MSKAKLTLLIILGIAVLIGIGFYSNFFQRRSAIPFLDTNEIQTAAVIDAKKAPRLGILASNLEVPWALTFLPDRSILFTERLGRVRFIDKKGNLDPTPIDIDGALQTGEGGLLGITIHPNFSTNRFVYLYYTYANDNGQTLNRVARFKFEDNKNFVEKTIIVDAIPGALFHNGGRIKFGPDGFLYIATGDSQNPSLAQDKDSMAGKILRVRDDGKPAPNNPFNSRIYSYGHRNPQGLSWDEDGRLWATEHGPSTVDELNIIEKGKNYGWPVITGDETQNGMEASIINSGFDTWAPSGAAYLNNSIFFGGLRGQTLYEAVIDGHRVILKEHLKGEVGRIREVIVGPDNLLYITTSNRDGRGAPDNTDDKIIRVNPNKL